VLARIKARWSRRHGEARDVRRQQAVHPAKQLSHGPRSRNIKAHNLPAGVYTSIQSPNGPYRHALAIHQARDHVLDSALNGLDVGLRLPPDVSTPVPSKQGPHTSKIIHVHGC
jgi:hypothetical protein